MNEWLRDSVGLGRYLELLQDQEFAARGFYRAAEVRRAIRDHLSRQRNYTRELVSLIYFELWYRQFIDGESIS